MQRKWSFGWHSLDSFAVDLTADEQHVRESRVEWRFSGPEGGFCI